jgi:hypothetical protein
MPKNSQLKTFLFALVAVAVAAPIVPILHYLGRPDLERPSFYAAATLAVAVEVCRDLSRRLWFWVSMVVIAAVHVPLILLLPWQSGWIPSPLIFMCVVADFVIILAFISFIEKLMNRTQHRI